MSKSPDAFRTISEVAEWLGVQTHVLRFWESKFSQVKPVKRAGGRRYYRPTDMLLLGGIRKLLHDDGLTIKGVQKILREEGVAHVADLSKPLDDLTQAELDESLAPKAATDKGARAETTAPAPEPEAPAPPASQDAPAEEPDEPSIAAAADVPPPEPDVQPPAERPADLAAEPAQAEAATPMPATEPSTAPPPQEEPPVAEAPRARQVDAPDEPPDEGQPLAPGALARATRVRHLTAERADELRPLLAQLAAVRDRMASARKDARPD